MKQNTIKVGSDFSGVGAFNYALKNNNIKYKELFACDMDKFARQSFIANHGEPIYYPQNVYEREIPSESLDIYMTSPPCQSFSLAGKRKGKDSDNGILFFNSYEFIQKNKPRYFIFENVKGLLSDDNGKTFKEWETMLGGKSVNGNAVIFPFENSVPYHIYYKVLNSKKHNVPQNRERVFIVGIRDDSDNFFTWPKEEHLTTKLKDILEKDVPEKYFLSDKAINGLINHTEKMKAKGNGFSFKPKKGTDIGSCVTARCFKNGVDDNYIKVKSATSNGYEVATENDSINFKNINSKTRRGRVEKEIAQTLDTDCNQAVLVSKEVRTNESKKTRRETGTNDFRGKQLEFRNQDHINTITTGLTKDHYLKLGYKIRRLTPRECFRLQDFPDSFKFVVSDSQLYKQAGNSITVKVLQLIIEKFNFQC